ncbi:MAG: ABC transporter ATP-binding protein [Verrucomicrobiota bacterium]
MAEIEFRKVKKIFPGNTVALEDFSLKVADGEFVVIVGPSGCGKSTALRILAGLESATEGELRIDGELVNDRTPQERNIAMVFQNYALYPHKTVRANMDFPLRMMGLAQEEREKRIEKTAEILGLANYLDRKPKQLSGGQRQRAAMGRALVRDPLVSLMDEPLSNLDAKLRVEIRAEMADLQREIGITTVYVTHDQVEAMTLGDRVAVLSDGRLQQCAPPQEIYEHPANVFVATFIGSPRMNVLPAKLRQKGGDLAVEFGDHFLRFEPRRHEDRDPIENQVDKDVLAGFRPEAFCRADEVEEAFRLKGTVQTAEALGHERIVYFDASVEVYLPPGVSRKSEQSERGKQERSLIARLPAGEVPEAGDEIELGLKTDEIYLFDEEGGAL